MPQQIDPRTATPSSATSEDMGVHKDGVASPVVASTALKEFASRTLGAKAELDAGVMRALAAAFDQFNEELRPDGQLRLDVVNGVIEGTASGLREFFSELSKVSEQARTTYVASRARMPVTAEIDYERLADLIAERMADKAKSRP
jgi:hypothetical protein